MKSKLILTLLFMSLLVLPTVSAFQWCDWIPFWECQDDTTLNTLTATQKWMLDYSTDEDFFVWTENSTKHKTTICLLSNTINDKKDLPDKTFFTGEKTSKEELKAMTKEEAKAVKKAEKENFKEQPKLKAKEMKVKDTGLDRDYVGYCYEVKGDKEKKVKFGEHSTVVTYQDEVLQVTDENNNIIQEVTLEYNSENCLIDCEARGHTVLYNNSVMFEDFDLKDIDGNLVDVEQSTIYLVETITETITSPRYETTCDSTSIHANCTNTLIGYENFTYDTEVYTTYYGGILPAGNYEWAIKAKKKPYQSLDWAVSFAGFETDTIRTYWAWWNSSWLYKKPIYANTSQGSFATGYQIQLTITHESNMNGDFSDVRFLNVDEDTELSYYLEDYTTNTSATFWVKLDDEFNSTNQTVAYMYYGNDAITLDTSNPYTTFDLYDDFDSAPLNTSKWTALEGTPTFANGNIQISSAMIISTVNFGYGYAFETYANQIWSDATTLMGQSSTASAFNGDYSYFGYNCNAGSYANYDGSTTDSNCPGGYPFTPGIQVTIGFSNSSAIDYLIDDSLQVQSTSSIPDADLYYGIRGWGGGSNTFDYSRVRRYNPYPEAYSLGVQESSVNNITLTLVEPENDYFSGSNSVDFQCNCVSIAGDNCTQVNLTIDDVVVETDTGTGSFNLTSTETVAEGEHNWTCFALNEFDTVYNTTTWNFTVDTTDPAVTITAPANETVIYQENESIEVNYTISDTNLDSCWYNLLNKTPSNVISYYTLDGYKDYPTDLLGNNNLYLIGNNNLVSGKINQSYSFIEDGYLDFKNEFSYDLNNDFTISLWFSPGDLDDNQLISFADPDSLNTRLDLYCGNSGCTLTSGAGVCANSLSITESFVDGNWYHLLISYNSSSETMTAYLDNNLEGSYVKGVLPACEFYDNTNSLIRIGGKRNGSIYDDWNGSIDELAIFNKVLDTTERASIYNSGSGNRTVSVNQTVDLNCLSSNFTSYYPIDNPDVVIYNVLGSDLSGRVGVDTVTLLRSTTAPVITIDSPQTLYSSLVDNQTVDIDFSISNTTVLDDCWYSYNGTNTTIDCVTNDTFNYIDSVNSLTLYANDTLGNLGSESVSWIVLAVVEDIIYESEVIETDVTTFKLISALTENVTAVTGVLVYDGRQYSTTPSIGTNTTNLTATIDVPLVDNDENVTFYFTLNVTTNDGSGSTDTDSNNQTVYNLEITNCDAGNSTEIVNYTTRVARSPFALLNTTFASTWYYYLSNGTGNVQVEASYEDTVEDNSTYSFCLNFNETVTVSNQVEVAATGYVPSSNFLVEAELNYENTTSQTVYLLNTSLADATVLQVYDNAGFAIGDVLINVQYFDIGTNSFITVTQALTSTIGSDVVYLNWLDSLYKFVLVKDGVTLQTTLPENIFESPRIFDIQENNTFQFLKFEDIDYNLYYSNTTQDFYLTYSRPDGKFSEGCLRVLKREASGDIVICDTCSTAASATLLCNIAAYGNGTFIANFYGTGSPAVSLAWLLEIIGDNFSMTIGEALGAEDSTFYAFAMGILVVGVMFINPVAGIIAILVSLFISSLLGFLIIDYATLIGISVVGGILAWIIKG